MTELLGCPFCGGAPTMWVATDCNDGFVHGTTINCPTCGISINDEYQDAAIAAWNHRHSGGDGDDSARLDWLCSGRQKKVERTLSDGWFRVYQDVASIMDPEDWHAMTDQFYPTTREAIDAARAGERG